MSFIRVLFFIALLIIGGSSSHCEDGVQEVPSRTLPKDAQTQERIRRLFEEARRRNPYGMEEMNANNAARFNNDFIWSQRIQQSTASDALMSGLRERSTLTELASDMELAESLQRQRKLAFERWREAARESEAEKSARADYEQLSQRIARLRIKDTRGKGEKRVGPLSLEQAQTLLRPNEVLVQFPFSQTKEREQIDRGFSIEAMERDYDLDFKPHEVRQYSWAITKDRVLRASPTIDANALARVIQKLRCGLDQSGEWTYDEINGQWIASQLCLDALGSSYARIGADDLLPFDLLSAHELYKALFDPLGDILEDKELLIVPSGALTRLPFGVLVTEKPTEPFPKTNEAFAATAWAAQRHAMTILPSVRSLAVIRAHKSVSQAPRPYLAFGNPLLEGDPDACGVAANCRKELQEHVDESRRKQTCNLRNGSSLSPRRASGRMPSDAVAALRKVAPLPETADEICAVAKVLGAVDADIFLGERDTIGAIKELQRQDRLSQYRVLHFATHGLLPHETEWFGQMGHALLMTPPAVPTEGDNGLLRDIDVAFLKIDADWVILSACNTGGGRWPESEALSGLVSAFLGAGARSVLASHWYVNSDAAVSLTTRAIAALDDATRQGRPVGRAEAFRLSIVATIQDKRLVNFGHPSSCGPFVFVGEGGARTD
jgi:CHAT domain-containing protein